MAALRHVQKEGSIVQFQVARQSEFNFGKISGGSGGKILSNPPLLVIRHASSFSSPLLVKSLFQRLQQLKYIAIGLQGKTSSLPWTLQLRQQTGIVCQVTLGDAGDKQVHHWAEDRGDSCGNELK